jgi:hypothetical protein
MQDLILNNLMLSMLDADMRKEWELHTVCQDIPFTTEAISLLETICKALELPQNTQTQ